MKIEICENTKITLIIIIIVAEIMMAICYAVNQQTETKKAAYSAGLEEINDTAATTHYGRK